MNSLGIICPAKVLCLSLEKPEVFQYSYLVNGITYQHFGFQCNVPALQVGSNIDVHYRPDQPEISYAGNTAKQLENEIVVALMSSIFIPLAVCFVLPTHIEPIREFFRLIHPASGK